MAVSAAAISPPVQLSAVASITLCDRHNANKASACVKMALSSNAAPY
jgi:hypothetical protein